MFQDELVKLLDECRIDSVAAFDKLPPQDKHYFITRLYKCFDKGLKHLGSELASLGGLKLHYARDLGNSNFNNRLEDTFLKKLAFYTSTSVVTCPIREVATAARPSKSKRMDKRDRFDSGTLLRLRSEGLYVFGDVKANKRTHGGEIHIEGRGYIVDRAALVSLLETILNLKQAIKSGLIQILPALPDRERELKTALRKGRVAQGNFSRSELVRQFTERDIANKNYVDIGLTSIYLPHVTNVPLQAILDLRSEEAELYSDFQRAIEDFVYISDHEVSEKKFEEYLRRVDEGVRAIRAKYQLLEKNWKLRKYEVGIEFLLMCFVQFAPTELAKYITPVLGAVTAVDFLRVNREYREQRNAVTSDTFFVAWRLGELEAMYPWPSPNSVFAHK